VRPASRISILILAAVLSGCATAPKQSVPVRELGAIQHWQASGRMAVSGAESGGSGSFNWKQMGEAATVQLRGPVGVGSLRLQIDDRNLRIETGEQVLEADAAQDELLARLGARVPTQALRYWLLGLPAPGDHAWVTTGANATLEQNAWRIDYQQYGITDGVRLPTKLVATSGAAKVRIVIDRWRLNE
jgi:outer membrane lipoprotein LolB